jgi:hypothetical protein
MDRFQNALCFLVASTSTLLGTTAVCGTTIRSPTVVLGTDLGTFDPITPLENMINQSGLDKSFTSGVTDFDEYFTTGASPFAQANGDNNWQSDFTFNLPLMGFVDFDFGAVYSIDRLAIWNRSLENVKILTSPTSINDVAEVASLRLTNHLNFPFSYVHEFVDLGGAHDVRFLRIEIDSAYKFDITDTFAYAIVGEVVASAAPIDSELEGDYNGNGAVDAADYVVWRDTLNQSGDDLAADGDSDGTIDPDDYDVWKMHFGEGPGAGGFTAAQESIPVPESTPALLMLLCVAALRVRTELQRRRGQGHHGNVIPAAA